MRNKQDITVDIAVIARRLCLTATAITFALFACNSNKLQVYDLRCEYLTEPSGIDNPYALEQMTAWDYSPRLSWKCKMQKAECKRQKAYRVTVALSEKDLKSGNNLLWDSGIVESAEQFCFLPKGIMRSHTKYYWQ